MPAGTAAAMSRAGDAREHRVNRERLESLRRISAALGDEQLAMSNSSGPTLRQLPPATNAPNAA